MNFSWTGFYEYSSDAGVAAASASQRRRTATRTLFSEILTRPLEL